MADGQLTILQMNDSHGYVDLHREMFWEGARETYRNVGGYGRTARLLQDIRSAHPGGVLAFDCGDTIHGTHTAVDTQGQALVPILNTMQFDAWTAHWEFAYGPDRLRQIVADLNYPMLAINCYEKATRNLAFEPYVIKEASGLRVGVIGIAATIVDKTMPAHFSEGLYFTLGNEELPGYIERLRGEEEVDLIVLISHLGFPQEVKLAQEVNGIDVLLSGHTHNRIYHPVLVNSTILIQSGCHGSFLGRLDLAIEDGKITGYNHDLIVVEEAIDPDPDVQALVEEAVAPHRRELARVAGETVTPLNRYRVMEATMDNLLLQSMLEVSGAQLAFSNGWRYGAPVVPGPVTVGDLWNIIPVDPPVMTCRLTGDELREMLEDNLERTFARDPYDQMGGYVKRCMGLNLYFKVENPRGTRICELFVGGKQVRPDESYDVCFVTEQGVPAKYGSDREALDIHAIEALQRYLAKNNPVRADLQGTVVAV